MAEATEPAAPSAGTRSAEPAARRRRRAVDAIDDLDAQIIDLLAVDGRLANRRIAAETGLAEATVAARIRNLVDRQILGVTVVIDWKQAGYSLDAWLVIAVDGDRVRDVANEIRATRGLHALFVVLGSADLLMHLLVRDLEELHDTLQHLSRIRGVRRIQPQVVIQTSKYDIRYARFPLDDAWSAVVQTAPGLDDVDRSLVAELAGDGRRSNRDIARTIELSEGAVRQRLRRLEASGFLRIAGQSDPFIMGLVDAWAVVGIGVANGAGAHVAQELGRFDDVLIVSTSVGRHDLLAFLASRTRTELAKRIVDDIRAIDGVVCTETWDVVSTVHLSYHLVRLVDGDDRTDG